MVLLAKIKKKKSFLWNLLFHALVNYLKMSQNASFWMLSEKEFRGSKLSPYSPHLLSCSRFKFFSLFNTILLNTLLTYMKLIVSYPKILLFQYDASVNHKYKVFNQIIILTLKKKNCHIVLMKIFRSLVWNNSFFLFFSKAEIPIVHQCSGHRQKMQALLLLPSHHGFQ